MTASSLSPDIDELWERRDALPAGAPPGAPGTPAASAEATVREALEQLETGAARVARVDAATDQVVVDERAKRAILLAFRVLPMVEGQEGGAFSHDRLALKTRFPGVRVVPGALARVGSFHAPGSVLMPSYTNVGAYVDEGTMVDTWATVGSCAQIGKRVHLSGGVGIGGVLEPPQASPVVVEDDAYVGSRAMVVEGARIRRGAKLGAGAILTASTRVFDVETGEELPRGEAPERAVCVGGTRPRRFAGGEFALPCLLVLRRLAEGEVHDKLALNAVLREHGVAP